MYQPNFLEVETRLRRAVAFCDAHPELVSSRDYRGRLQAILQHFMDVTQSTDRLYTSWRLKLGEQLLAFKRARQDWDRIVALCDEHAVDGLPRKPIVYTEFAPLIERLRETVAFLDAHPADWDWMTEMSRRLERAIGEAEELKKQAATIYGDYTVQVKRRVAAWEDAVAILKEYLGDSRLEAKRLDGYRDLEMRID